MTPENVSQSTNGANAPTVNSTQGHALPPGFTLRETRADGSQEYFLNMGPQHPSTHGVLKLVVRLEGETVIEVVPHLGFIHRAIEKMGENETFVQYIHLTDRMDYLSSHINNLCVCMAIEKAMGIGVPERGEYIRVMVSELQRIQSHLLWWGAFGMDLGAVSAFLYGFKEREKITALFEELCGARLTMNFFRPGGSNADVPGGFIAKVKEIVEDMKFSLDEFDALVSKNPIIRERTVGVGALSRERAISYGCSGPVGRASGVDFDVRKNDPYSVYDRFQFDVPLGKNGDCFDRYTVRMLEMRESIRILEQAMASFPEGQYRSKEKPAYKVPAGSYYANVETARGLYATYMVSDNSFKPYRIKSRSPNMSNLSAINEMSKGGKIADLVAILSTLDLIIPDIDR
jgi:NADH-quinone oxidoreductase subunit D/NADH-quinone oxidoreductase subunit C/D